MSPNGSGINLQSVVRKHLRIWLVLIISAFLSVAAALFAESAFANATSRPVIFIKPLTYWQSGSWQSPGTIKVAAARWDQTPSKAPVSISYQWQSSNDGSTWVAIQGATSDSFIVPNGYQGKTFRVLITATNAAGSTTITNAVDRYFPTGGTDLVSNIGDVTTNSNPTAPLSVANVGSWPTYGKTINSCTNNSQYYFLATNNGYLKVMLKTPRPEVYLNLFNDNIAEKITIYTSADQVQKTELTPTNQIYSYGRISGTVFLSPATYATRSGADQVYVSLEAPEGGLVYGFRIDWGAGGIVNSADGALDCRGLQGVSESYYSFVAASAAGAPIISTVTPSSGAATISFSAPEFNGGAAITNYKYSTNGSTYTAFNPTSTTSPFTISGLTNGTTYSVTIKAVNSAGDSVASNSVSVTPFGAPGTPDLATASDLGSSSTDNNTADDTPTISIGSGLLIGATVTITATPGSGNPVTCIIIATSTSGSCTFTSLPNETYSITATQTSSGVTSAASSALTNVVINKVVIPTPTSAPDLDPSSDSGESNSDNITNDNTPTISYAGSITGTGTIRATKAGTGDVTCTISSGSCTLGTLTDGLWSIVVVDTDTSGNSATSAGLSITVDTVAPTATVSVQTVSNTTSVNVQSSEAGVAYLVRSNQSPSSVTTILSYLDNLWNQVTISGANTNALLSTVGLDFGTAGGAGGNTFKLYVADNAGNLSSANSNLVTVKSAYGPSINGVPLDSGTGQIAKVGDYLVPFLGGVNGHDKTGSTNSRVELGLPLGSFSYEWYDCGTETILDGESGPSLTLTESRAGKSFKVKVIVTNSVSSVNQTSGCSNSIGANVPSAPTSLIATPGDRIATISFTAPSSTGGAVITNYSYAIGSTNSTSGLTFVDLNPVKTSSPVTVANGLNLANGTTYYVFLKAINSAGSSEASTSVMVTPATTPSAPTSLSCGSPCSSNISFTAGSNGGSTITNYKYSINGGEYVALSPSDATSPISIPGLIKGVSYTLNLKAVNSLGESGTSSTLTFRPMGTRQKQLFLATPQFQQTGSQVILATSGGSGTGSVTYRIARSNIESISNSGTSNYFNYPASDADCTLINGNNLTKASSGICYIILEKAGDLTYSPWIGDGVDASTPLYAVYFQTGALPGAVNGISTSKGSSSTILNVSWANNPPNSAGIWSLSNTSGYQLWLWKPPYDADHALTNSVPTSTDLNVIGNTNVAFRYASSSWGDFSIQNASPWMAVASNLASTNGANKALDLFSIPNYANGEINYFQLCTFTTVSITGVGSTVLNNAPGTPGCTLFRVSTATGLVIAPLSASTAISASSLTSGIAATTFTPITTSGGVGNKSFSITPALPAGLSLNSSTGAISGTPTTASVSTSYTVTVTDSSSTVSSTFLLSVNPALTASSGSIPANIYKDSPVTPFYPVSFSGGTSSITYTVSPSLPAGLTLNSSTGAVSGTPTSTAVNATYTITATDANGDTETGTFSTQVIMPTAPGAPTIGIAAATGQTTATVSFTAPSSTGGSTITGYSVIASPGGITVSGSSSPITVTGLTAGTTYTFTVSATNAIGTSSTSAASGSITTQSAQVAPTPSAPSTPNTPAVDPTPVAPSCDASCQAIRDAAETKAAADAAAKAAADKAAADAAAKLKADADARNASDKASAAAKAAADAAKAAVEKAAAAAAAKAAADAAAATAAAQAKAAADAQAAANKAAAAAQAALKNSAASAAAKAAATASANKAAADAAAAVKAAATAAQNATKAKTAEANANKQVDIAINSLSSKTASAQATAEANAVAAAAKAAANEAAAAATAKAEAAKATASAAQKAAADAAARISTEQKEAAAAAAAAKAAADAAAKASAEKIAATNAAKTASENLLKVLEEKATLADQAAKTSDENVRAEIAKKLEEIEVKAVEAEKIAEEATAEADDAVAEYEEAIDDAAEATEIAETQAAEAVAVKAESVTKTAVATKAAAAATVAAKVATAAKAAAAKVPSKAVITKKPATTAGKNSATATVTGLKPGQKVKVTVNVKPKP
jgi:hypothetical protein